MPLTEPLPYMLRETRRARLAEVPLLAEAVRWFEHCRMLRDYENKLQAQPSDEDLRAHRVVIADLIADGEILAWQARQTGTDLSVCWLRWSNWLGRPSSERFPKPIAPAALPAAAVITADVNTGPTSMSVTAARQAKPPAIMYLKQSSHSYGKGSKPGAASKRTFGS